MLAFWTARPTLAAAAIYAALSIVFVGQGLLPGRTLSSSDWALGQVPWQSSKPANVPGLGTNFELADSADVFQPFLQYTRSELPKVPLWNPYIGDGRPFLADGQSAVFSVFSIPSYILPFWKSLAVVAILKLFIAAFGTYLLARTLGLRFGGALLSGLVFAFGTFFVVWLAWPLSSVFAFIPWALMLTELLIRRPGRLTVAGLAAVIGIQFLSGHPESSFHLVFTTIVFFIFRALLHRHRQKGDLRSLVRPALAFTISLLSGVALAALMLIPFAEFVLHSGDLARRINTSAGYWPRKYVGALFLHDYWGRPTQTDLEPFMQIRGWYVGAVTLMLATTALVLKRSVERIAVVVYGLFCTCMVIGIPPVFGFVSRLPGFDAVHNERLLIYVPLCLGLLAGWGLDELSSLRLPRLGYRRAVLAASVGIFCVPIVWMLLAGTLSFHELGSGLKVAWGFVHPPVPPPGVSAEGTYIGAIVRDSALLMWLPLAGAGLALVAWRLRAARRLPAGAFVALTVALLVVDLFRANMGFNPAISKRNAAPPVTGAIRYLQSQRPNRFIGVSTVAISQPVPTDYAMRFGLYDARGYDYPVEKRLDALWRRSVANAPLLNFTQPEQFASATPAALRALDLLSVSDLVVGPEQAIKLNLHGPGLRVAYKGKDAVVYSNARALPRVFVVDHQETVRSDPAALATVTAPSFDGRGVAVTDAPLPGLPQARTARPPLGATARFASYGAERIVIDASAPDRSLLVLTDDSYPGWTVTVDGHPATVHRVDYLLRGVSLGPGHHTIVFRYQPVSWRVGWIISLCALLGVLGALATLLRGRGRRVRSSSVETASG